MQPSLFPDQPDQPFASVRPATQDDALRALAGQLPATLRLGTSSWHYPGWAALVWDKLYTEAQLSRDGLPAYAQHPLFRTVGVDRGFYRPMTTDQYAAYAALVPDDFRFVIKAPSLVTDEQVRGPRGHGRDDKPAFLSKDAAIAQYAEPALAAFGHKLGALVFQ